jgi:hypothetical protein
MQFDANDTPKGYNSNSSVHKINLRPHLENDTDDNDDLRGATTNSRI